MRQIHLVRPGEEELYLVTDLLDEQKYPAEDLLAVYLKRWGIERVFQKITEVFHLERLWEARRRRRSSRQHSA